MEFQCRLRITPIEREQILSLSTLAHTPLYKVDIQVNIKNLKYIVGERKYCAFKASHAILLALTRSGVKYLKDSAFC